MPPQGKADPAIYPKMRDLGMHMELPTSGDGVVRTVLMDWHVTAGTVTVMAAADGTASLYLSSGGGFIGGGESKPILHEAALHAIQLANGLVAKANAVDSSPLPREGVVYFYFNTHAGLRRAEAAEADLKSGTSEFSKLGGAMQAIVTGYRTMR